MQRFSSAKQLQDACNEARQSGRRVGLVPTMGALHEGHLALVQRAAKEGADFIVVTLFVNPLQFGPKEDFARYPRPLEDDLRQCQDNGVDLVFTPSEQEMYPKGFQTHVEVSELTRHMEGKARPNHFRGVTTVVAKLFLLTGPCVAVFGRKDYQQWKVIERMTRDLHFPVDVIGHPTVRESDGLARSSRNRYLTEAERRRAPCLFNALQAAAQSFDNGQRKAEDLEQLVRERIAEDTDAIDYVTLADPETLQPLSGWIDGTALVATAARIGNVRLIDSLVLGTGDDFSLPFGQKPTDAA